MPAWIAWILLTLISWGVWAVLFRLVGDQLSPAHSQAISTLGILPVLAALAVRKDDLASGAMQQRGRLLALAAGLISCLGNLACYEALKHAKAATVVPLTALYPVVTISLAVPLLGERIVRRQWIGIGCSIVAIYLFNAPQPGQHLIVDAVGGMVFPLAAIVLWGITGVVQKAATNHTSARGTAIWFLAAFLPMAGLILMVQPLESEISTRTWTLAVLMGFTLALGNLTILLAFASGGKASVIAPLAGLYPLVSIPIAIIAFGERLVGREVAAIVLALGAVILLSLQHTPGVAAATTNSDTSS